MKKKKFDLVKAIKKAARKNTAGLNLVTKVQDTDKYDRKSENARLKKSLRDETDDDREK